MIWVAVIGPPGSGKTAVLTELATRLQERGKAVSGFLALAGERPDPSKGALRYDLLKLPSGERVPFAVRDESLEPIPYRFESIDPTDFGVPDVVLLDEIGQLELEGRGHAESWPNLISANPPVVVIAVKEHLVADLEGKFGFRFDLKVEASEVTAMDRLVEVCAEPRDWEAVGLFGGASGAVEVTLGSALHGGHVPLRGQVLSTLQALMLTSAAEGLKQKERVAWVAIISAALKALSPAGNRLRPMIAISSQGIMFSVAIRLLGWNALAVAVGGFFVGAWAAVQGVVLQWILVGGEIFKAYDSAVKWLAHSLHLGDPSFPAVLTAIVLLSGVFTAVSCLFYWRRRHRGLEKLNTYAERKTTRNIQPTTRKEAILGAIKDLLHPAFWLPLVVIIAILKLSGTAWNETFWVAMRAAGIAIVLFAVARMFDPLRFARWLRKRGLYGPAIGFERVFRRDR